MLRKIVNTKGDSRTANAQINLENLCKFLLRDEVKNKIPKGKIPLSKRCLF